MEMKNLRDWYVDLLKDAYSAETQITEALPNAYGLNRSQTITARAAVQPPTFAAMGAVLTLELALDDKGRLVHVSAVQTNDEIIDGLADYVSGDCLVALDAPLIVKNATGNRPAASTPA